MKFTKTARMQRDFVPIQEVVKANAKVLELDVPGVLALNIGSGVSKTIMQVAEYLKTEIGSRAILLSAAAIV